MMWHFCLEKRRLENVSFFVISKVEHLNSYHIIFKTDIRVIS